MTVRNRQDDETLRALGRSKSHDGGKLVQSNETGVLAVAAVEGVRSCILEMTLCDDGLRDIEHVHLGSGGVEHGVLHREVWKSRVRGASGVIGLPEAVAR